MEELGLGDDPDYKTIGGKAHERRDDPQRRHCGKINVHDEHPWIIIKSDDQGIKWWDHSSAARPYLVEYDRYICPGVRRN